MDMKNLISEIWDDAKHIFLKFEAENDGKCCPECRKYHGRVFRDDSPDLPELPIHPNCRCRFRRIR